MSSSKTLWRDKQRVTRLIELAIAEFNTGRVKNGKLGAPNYESIAAIMSVDVPILDAQKIKTKLDNMCTEFRIFKDLKSRTGFGWDPKTKTVKADVEHWTAFIQIDEKYAKFMGRGLDNYDDLCYIFGNNTAKDLYHYAPAQDPTTSEEEQRLYDAARVFQLLLQIVMLFSTRPLILWDSMDNHDDEYYNLNEPYVSEDEGAYNVDEAANHEQEEPYELQGSDEDEEVGSVACDTTATSIDDSDNPDQGDDTIALYIIEETHHCSRNHEFSQFVLKGGVFGSFFVPQMTYRASYCSCEAGRMRLYMARMDKNYGRWFFRCPLRELTNNEISLFATHNVLSHRDGDTEGKSYD
ncbi:hypothetical protein CJ030_MR3G022812 [Morella rubra]|uniref:Myb/SANT-like domain-containing protein n=1 Tax=Morella rubra TaxID=262757 RepID=A0A6A1W3Z9_9ROSI|nr:hypothetical protein CJ030_MR3G022812 [Morella rubra]